MVMGGRSALRAISELSGRAATGELICASSDLEVHVYLQRGRIAWATSSKAELAFSRDLLRRTGVDRETFREIVEDCRKSRRPLGETLVAWNLATREDVRESLRLQVQHALSTLDGRDDVATIFLERGERYMSYDTALTFETAEVVPEPRARNDTRRSSAPPNLIDHVLAVLPDVRWIEVRRSGRVELVHPTSTSAHDSTETVRELAFGGDVDVVAVRAGLGALVGLAYGEDRTVWLCPDRETSIGAVLAAIGSLLHGPDPQPRRTAPLGAPRSVGEGCEACRRAVCDCLARLPELAAVALRDAHGHDFTCYREGFDIDSASHLQARRSDILRVDAIVDDISHPRDTQVDAYGISNRSLLLGRHDEWHLASTLLDGTHRTLWLTTSRHASLGLAWALMTATVRELARVPCAHVAA
jgi:hypothetical protein